MHVGTTCLSANERDTVHELRLGAECHSCVGTRVVFLQKLKILFLGSSCQGVTWQCSKIEIDLCNMGLLFGVNPISFFLILTTSLTKSKLKQKERLLFVCLFFKYNVEAYIFTLQRCFQWKNYIAKLSRSNKQSQCPWRKDFYSRTIFQSSYENFSVFCCLHYHV